MNIFFNWLEKYNYFSVPKPLPRSPKTDGVYGSPESPLSKMDIMTVGEYVQF